MINFCFLKKKICFSKYIKIKNLRPEEENIVKDIRNLFRLESETKGIKDRILRDFKNHFEHEEENYYEIVRVSNFWSNNYI